MDRQVIEVTSREQFLTVVPAHTGPVLLYFYGPSCGFCKAAWPRVEKALQGKPQVLCVKVDDESTEGGSLLADDWGVSRNPSFFYSANATDLIPGRAPQVELDPLLGILAGGKSGRKRRNRHA